jgi:hypothetical protein
LIAGRRRNIRRNASLLGLIALAFYLGFIVIAMMRGSP